MNRCELCGRKIRFIKRAGHKALPVNINPIYFIPDDRAGETFITSSGTFRRGEKASDGIKGFVLHEC